MILRKPYRILIKSFKFIHLILTLLMVYTLYRFSRIISFFDVAISSYTGVLSTNPTAFLYDIYIYLTIFVIIIFTLVIIFLLFMKKKPIKLYIGTIIIYIIAFIVIAYSYNVVGNMEVKIVDPKILRNTKDFLMIISMVQVVEIILYGIRALGFDIKKFNFKDDLKEFDIVAEDNEEFELNVNVDVNKMHRKVNKGKRFFHYFYVENRYLFFFVSCLSICILSLVIYLSLGVYNKRYTQNEYFKTTEFMFSINNSYLTSKDYKGNNISNNNTLVVLEISVKSNSSSGAKLNLARLELIVGNNKYYHTAIYNDSLSDLGNTYQNQLIPNAFTKYLLVYEIPNQLLSDDIEFRYIDKNASITKLDTKSITIDINTRNLDENKKIQEYSLGDTISFSGSILENTDFVLTNYLIQNRFIIPYQFCIKNTCYDSIEILNPSINNNYDKILMQITSSINWDDNVATNKITDVFKFLSMFGRFEYTINGVKKSDPSVLKSSIPNRTQMSDIYFLELIDEIQNAEMIDLVLKVRDYTYIYHIK